jgi:NADH:ubiquinone oxidoreductase subunit 6 (subunit J)
MGAVIALELAAVLLGGFRISEPQKPAGAQLVMPAVVAQPAASTPVDAASAAADAASAALPVASQAAADVGHVVVAQVSNTKELGVLLYTQYLYPVQVAALILLVALIAAIALTLRARKDSKYQNPADQVRVKARDRVTVVKMAAVKPPVAPAAEEEKSA